MKSNKLLSTAITKGVVLDFAVKTWKPVEISSYVKTLTLLSCWISIKMKPEPMKHGQGRNTKYYMISLHVHSISLALKTIGRLVW